MKCAEAEVMLHALVDSELDAGNAHEVERHAVTCASCSEQLEAFRAMREVMAGVELKETAPRVFARASSRPYQHRAGA